MAGQGPQSHRVSLAPDLLSLHRAGSGQEGGLSLAASSETCPRLRRVTWDPSIPCVVTCNGEQLATLDPPAVPSAGRLPLPHPAALLPALPGDATPPGDSSERQQDFHVQVLGVLVALFS